MDGGAQLGLVSSPAARSVRLWRRWRVASAARVPLRFVAHLVVIVASMLFEEVPLLSLLSDERRQEGRRQHRVKLVVGLSTHPKLARRPRTFGRSLALWCHAGAVPGRLAYEEGKDSTYWYPTEDLGVLDLLWPRASVVSIETATYRWGSRRVVRVLFDDGADVWLTGRATGPLADLIA